MMKANKNCKKTTGNRGNQFSRPRPTIPSALLRVFIDNIVAGIFSLPRPVQSLDPKAMKRLLLQTTRRLLIAADADQNADHEKWEAAVGLLQVKVEVGHGSVLAAMEALNALTGGKLPVRTVNLRSQMIKLFLAKEAGEEVTISLLRQKPRLLAEFDFSKFYKALGECGSQKAFLAKLYPGEDSDLNSSSTQKQTTPLDKIKADVGKLAARINALPSGEQTQATEFVKVVIVNPSVISAPDLERKNFQPRRKVSGWGKATTQKTASTRKE